MLSSTFQLHRGSRQGCALSPLLFALALEPLAHVIWSDPNIYRYNTKNTISKISLYADDILLYITKRQVTIARILKVISHFGTFLGYKINWSKSDLMPIKVWDLSVARKLFQFWRSLLISWVNIWRVNIIKMIFLPQILYLFQNIPVFFPKNFFKQLDFVGF